MCTASNWPRTGLWTELRVYRPTSHANRRRSRGGDLNAAASAAVNAKPSSIHIARGGALALAHRHHFNAHRQVPMLFVARMLKPPVGRS